jgi:hypothetical protein
MKQIWILVRTEQGSNLRNHMLYVDVNLLEENINTIKKNKKCLLDTVGTRPQDDSPSFEDVFILPSPFQGPQYGRP